MNNYYIETLDIITDCEMVQVSAWVNIIGEPDENSWLMSLSFDPFKKNGETITWDNSEYVRSLKTPTVDQITELRKDLFEVGIPEEKIESYILDIHKMIIQLEDTCSIIRKARNHGSITG